MSGQPLLNLLAIVSKVFLYVLRHQVFRGAGKDLGGAKPLFATPQKCLCPRETEDETTKLIVKMSNVYNETKYIT